MENHDILKKGSIEGDKTQIERKKRSTIKICV